MNPETRYSGTFRAEPFSDEEEIWHDDLPTVKRWLVRHLEQEPNPDYARLRDHQDSVTIYEESSDE